MVGWVERRRGVRPTGIVGDSGGNRRDRSRLDPPYKATLDPQKEPSPWPSPTEATRSSGSRRLPGEGAQRRPRVVPVVGPRLRRAVLRRHHLLVRPARQRPRPGPAGRCRRRGLRQPAGIPGHAALRLVGRGAAPRPRPGTAALRRIRYRAAPQDGRAGDRADRRAQDLAPRPRRGPRLARPAHPPAC